MGKKIRARGKIVLCARALGDNPFLDGFTEWTDSPEGQLADEARDTGRSSIPHASMPSAARSVAQAHRPTDIEKVAHRIREDHITRYGTHRRRGHLRIRNGVCAGELLPNGRLERRIDAWISLN
jgi:hypothetical protein